MRIHKLVMSVIVLLHVSGCATVGISNNPDKIIDSGKSNIVLFSYDITLPDVNPLENATLAYAYLCESTATSNKLTGCFQTHILADTSSGYAGKNLSAYEKKYGDYMYTHILYSVPAGMDPVMSCQEVPTANRGGSSTLKATVCNKTKQIKYKTNRVVLPQPIQISVTPGAGCFIGHVAIEIDSLDIVRYNFNDQLDTIDLSLADDEIREKLGSHITRACSVTP